MRVRPNPAVRSIRSSFAAPVFMLQCERSNRVMIIRMLKSWTSLPLRPNVAFGEYRTSSGRGMKAGWLLCYVLSFM